MLIVILIVFDDSDKIYTRSISILTLIVLNDNENDIDTDSFE